MKIKDLGEKAVFKIELRGKAKIAELVKFNGTRAEVLFKGDKKPLNLNVECEILSVLSNGVAKTEPKQEAKETPKTTAKSRKTVKEA